jgi:hypothetical protein
VRAAGKKTFGGGCSGQARLSGVPAGVAPVACTKRSDGVGEEIGDDATGMVRRGGGVFRRLPVQLARL